MESRFAVCLRWIRSRLQDTGISARDTSENHPSSSDLENSIIVLSLQIALFKVKCVRNDLPQSNLVFDIRILITPSADRNEKYGSS